MVVRAGAAKPDISSVEAFRSTLLAAKSIAYSDSGSGTYLSTTLFAKLGIADQIAGKSRKVRGPRRGGDGLPTGRRSDPCRRNYLCRPDPGRTPTDVFFRGRAHQYGPASRVL